MNIQRIILNDHDSGRLIIPDYQQVIIEESEDLIALTLEIIVGAYASVTYTLQSKNHLISQRNITFTLVGDHGAVECTSKGFYGTNQRYALTINQVHQGAHTTSSVSLQMVVNEAAHCSYSGMITIGKFATKSVASQSHKTIVLSSFAHVTSEPRLEVLTNDVQCNYGSAISYLNLQELHYLMSRGLTEDSAKQLIIDGFLQS